MQDGVWKSFLVECAKMVIFIAPEQGVQRWFTRFEEGRAARIKATHEAQDRAAELEPCLGLRISGHSVPERFGERLPSERSPSTQAGGPRTARDCGVSPVHTPNHDNRQIDMWPFERRPRRSGETLNPEENSGEDARPIRLRDALALAILSVLVGGTLKELVARLPGLFFAPIDVDLPTEGEEEQCNPDFVSSRQSPRWYQRNGFANPTNCQDPVPATTAVEERISIPVYWVLLSERRGQGQQAEGWTRDMAKSKMDEAVAYFSRYCITIPTYEVLLKTTERRALRTRLHRADAKGPRAYENAISTTGEELWEAISKPDKHLLIMFVDAFNEVTYDQRPVTVAGNFSRIPVVLVPDPPEGRSTNIITHELIHGFGKVLRGKSSRPYRNGENRKNTWDEGACLNEMGNARRSNPDARLQKPNNAPLDWGSYWQFIENDNVR